MGGGASKSNSRVGDKYHHHGGGPKVTATVTNHFSVDVKKERQIPIGY